MKNEIAQAFLMEVLQSSEAEVFENNRRYFQNMARYKYDQYQQFAPGMRFIERFALWLKQFDIEDREPIFNFVRNRLVFVSNEEMNMLVASCFPDLIKKILTDAVANKLGIPKYNISKITSSKEYETLVKQSLFFGLSDGARTDVFRRANSGVISHEQIYQTYELSRERARKMQTDFLQKELVKLHGQDFDPVLGKFRTIILLDDFSASGTSYLKEKNDGELRGKIAQLYSGIFKSSEESLKQIFDVQNLDIHVILYMCTSQAFKQIEGVFEKLYDKYKNKPTLHCMHLIPDSFKLDSSKEKDIYDLCMKPQYYDPGIEDEHTGNSIQLGFASCSLPLVLSHNCPNNSLSMLWSYDHLQKFVGLFPRIPRHRVL
ncbi:MAG: hypothetical protein R2804_06280 [Cyclobacteriaceae bacterium]